MKKIVWIVVCAALLFALFGNGRKQERIMKNAIVYAEENTELLRACAKELARIIPETASKVSDTMLLYRIELTDNAKLRLYDYHEKNETEIQSALCREILNGNVVQTINLRRNNGVLSVEFFCGGAGIGSNTAYYEINYVSSGRPEDLFFYDSGMTYVEKNGGYFGTKDGDNTFFYYPIAEDLFYIEAHF